MLAFFREEGRRLAVAQQERLQAKQARAIARAAAGRRARSPPSAVTSDEEGEDDEAPGLRAMGLGLGAEAPEGLWEGDTQTLVSDESQKRRRWAWREAGGVADGNGGGGRGGGREGGYMAPDLQGDSDSSRVDDLMSLSDYLRGGTKAKP